MYQLVYISSAVGAVATAAILAKSQANNARNGVTGLLYADGKRFLQALEGERDVVERTYTRIAADPRHRGLVVLSKREVSEREFGPWAMAERTTAGDGDALIERVTALIEGAAPSVRATFDSFARLRRAA